MDHHYGYDLTGNIISISNALEATVSEGATSYIYDGNRLNEASGQEPAQYNTMITGMRYQTESEPLCITKTTV